MRMPWNRSSRRLTEPEEASAVDDLHDQACAEDRTDEGATPSEQRRSTQNNCGDRVESETLALGWVTDTQLRQQDDRPEKDEERHGHVSGEQSRCHTHTDLSSRLLVGTHRSKPESPRSPS